MKAEIVVIGGGPTGCTAATLLARAGRDVLIVDRDSEPRMVIGESLLPAGNRVLEKLGIEMDGFIVKRGAVFSRNEEIERIDFADAVDPHWPAAHQVKRHQLDARFRETARSAGVRWLEAQAMGADLPGRLRTSAGDIEAEWIVDAAGREQFLARQMGTRRRHELLRNAALVRYYRGVNLVEPAQPGDITVSAFEGGWFWFIPFADGEWSVGVVTTPGCGIRGDRWEGALALSADAAARLAGAEQIREQYGVQDFTAYADRFHGDGWMLAGDAALFLDPVFSSGVFLGIESADRLVEHFLAGTLDAYEADIREAATTFEKVVLAFYEGSFLDIVLAPQELQPFKYRQAIISLLAGDVFGGGPVEAQRVTRSFPAIARAIRNRMAQAG